MNHTPHPHIKSRKHQGVHTTAKEHLGFNGAVAKLITNLVGTMYCAYVFALIAFVALPAAIQAHSLIVLVNWLSGNFIQLVLLPVIIVGQMISARASDKQALQTYQDAEALLQISDDLHRLTKEIHENVIKTKKK